MAARRNRYWIGFFVLVALLTVGGIVTLITYNLQQQLKPEQLAAAEKLWEERGLKDYDLDYTIDRQDQNGITKEVYAIQVRHGRVVHGTFKTGPHLKGVPLKTRLYPLHNVPAFFHYLEDYLSQDAKPGAPRCFMTALFDQHDGHLLHFVRRVSGTVNRVEITVKQVAAAKTAPLTLQELHAAHQRWDNRQANLGDYRLEYLRRLGDERHGDRFQVAVREGVLESVKREGAVIAFKEAGVFDMASLFAQIEAWQGEDEAAKRTPGAAIFDPVNGQVRWYRRTEPAVEFLVDPAEPLTEQWRFGPQG